MTYGTNKTKLVVFFSKEALLEGKSGCSMLKCQYTETPSFRTIHIPDRGHFVRLIPGPKFTCSGIFLVRNLDVPKNYCPVNSCIFDKF